MIAMVYRAHQYLEFVVKKFLGFSENYVKYVMGQSIENFLESLKNEDEDLFEINDIQTTLNEEEVEEFQKNEQRSKVMSVGPQSD